MATEWRTYEEVAAYLLDQCAHELGLSKVEGKQKVSGLLSQTEWEIDAKGVREGDEWFVIIECRRYTKSKQNQEKMSSLAWKILDTGAQGGIIVSPLGLQEGARKVANAGNIVDVQLSLDSTAHEFAMRFLNKIFLGLQDGVSIRDNALVERISACARCGQRFSDEENEYVCPKCKQMEE